MNPIDGLWRIHREAEWPAFSAPSEGQLLTLDTVISGCVTYFLDSTDGLDQQRVEILEDCLADLDALLPEIPQEVSGYFVRLRTLASLVLNTQRRG